MSQRRQALQRVERAQERLRVGQRLAFGYVPQPLALRQPSQTGMRGVERDAGRLMPPPWALHSRCAQRQNPPRSPRPLAPRRSACAFARRASSGFLDFVLLRADSVRSPLRPRVATAAVLFVVVSGTDMCHRLLPQVCDVRRPALDCAPRPPHSAALCSPAPCSQGTS